MEKITSALGKLNFTKIEAEIYINLLQHPQLNGSQLAKIVNLTRSTVYNALNTLEKKGAAILIPGKTNVYLAEDPSILLDRLKKDFIASADSIKDDLAKISIKRPANGFANIQGYFNVISRVKEFLVSAKEEVFIHTNMKLNIFRDELLELAERGVRVVVFSFSIINSDDLPVEMYCSHKFDYKKYFVSKILLVVDHNNALIARGDDATEYNGVHSKNTILVDLVSEHIHHDIYLHKLEKKAGVKNIVSPDMLLNSLQEKSTEKHLRT